MKLSELKARGALVDRSLVEKEITWEHTDPETGEKTTDVFTVHVRRMGYGEVEGIFTAMPNDDPERSYNAAMISKAVVLGEDPQKAPEQFSYEQAYSLDPKLAYQLIGVINEVNRRGTSAKKRSRPPKKSGTNSSSTASGGERSKKPKSGSATPKSSTGQSTSEKTGP